jgi:cell division GTPase FtsZ
MDVLGDDVSMDEAFKAADNVLRNAVGGIAEIINFPGLVNVDFEDVRTVMGEMGMAMMGSANAAGVDRARIAAERAVASPLLEGVNLSGAKGVLVNITATRSLKMKEVNEVMNTVAPSPPTTRTSSSARSTTKQMAEDIRVTVVATGLGQAQAKADLRSDQQPVGMARLPEPTAVSCMGRTSTIRVSTRCRRSFARAQRDGRGAGQQRCRSLRYPGLPAQAGRLSRSGDSSSAGIGANSGPPGLC